MAGPAGTVVAVGRCPVTRREGLTPAQVEAWVKSSCERQGVPVEVTDPVVVASVVVLLTGREVQRRR